MLVTILSIHKVKVRTVKLNVSRIHDYLRTIMLSVSTLRLRLSALRRDIKRPYYHVVNSIAVLFTLYSSTE